MGAGVATDGERLGTAVATVGELDGVDDGDGVAIDGTEEGLGVAGTGAGVMGASVGGSVHPQVTMVYVGSSAQVSGSIQACSPNASTTRQVKGSRFGVNTIASRFVT